MIIDSNPNETRAYFDIVDFLNDKEIEEKIKKLEILENNKEQKNINKIYLYFALGEMFEKINKYNKP